MNIKTIGTSLQKAAKKAEFETKKHSPEIFMAIGVIGTIAGTVVACKATTKLDAILEETKEKTTQVREFDPEEVEVDVEYTEQDRKKDMAIVYLQSGVKIAKLYAPAMLIMGLSISSILVSCNILKKRNLALMTAYATLNKTFGDYRERVAKKYGDAVEEEIRYGIEKRKITEEVVDENGKKKAVKKEVEVATVDSDESTVFEFSEDTTTHFDSVMDYNRMFLSARQALAQDMLVANGYLFLNEVLDLLDLDRTADGFQLGWIYAPDNERGDNVIDFRMRESLKEIMDDEGNPMYKPVIYLDFNYDGVITNTKELKKAIAKNKRG